MDRNAPVGGIHRKHDGNDGGGSHRPTMVGTTASFRKRTDEEYDTLHKEAEEEYDGNYWESKLEQSAVNDIFESLFSMDHVEEEEEEEEEEKPRVRVAARVDDLVKEMSAEHVTEAWDTGGIPTYRLAALWGMGGKWVSKVEKKKQEAEVDLADCA